MTQLRVEIDKKLHQRLLMEAVKQETVLKELVPRLLNKALEDECRPNDGKQQSVAQSEGSSASSTATDTTSGHQVKASEVIQL